jgi:hydrogenase maturation protease
MEWDSHEERRRPIVVVGLGNLWRGDEGIGVHLLRALADKTALYPEVEFYELGTGGLALLHVIADRDKAILLDCAFMGATPGTLRRFGPGEVLSTKVLPRVSLHEGDVLQLLELARQLGQLPAEVVIFAVEPAEVCATDELSSALHTRLQEYLRQVEAELW